MENKMINGEFTGLKLPKKVVEKIYYKNAAKRLLTTLFLSSSDCNWFNERKEWKHSVYHDFFPIATEPIIPTTDKKQLLLLYNTLSIYMFAW